MIFPPVKVVAVDNVQEDLEAIVEVLNMLQCPCYKILYDGDIFLEKPFKGLRILFMDIHLQGPPHFEPTATLMEPVASAIKKVVSKDNGPYMLILWSHHADIFDKLMAFFQERHPDMPRPLAVDVLDKSLVNIEKPEEFKQKIISLLETCPQLQVLIYWENKINAAASSTLSELNSLLPNDSSWPPLEMRADMGKLLAKIAQEAVGSKNAQMDPENAVNEGLLPILVDGLTRYGGPETADLIWEKALIDLDKSQISLPYSLDLAKLNALNHIDTDVSSTKAIDRGAVIELPEGWLTEETFISIFSKKPDELIQEFLNLETLKEETDRKAKIEKCSWRLLEISAECDYAQQKERLLRYLLCLEIPGELSEYTTFKRGKGREDCGHEAIYPLPLYQLESGPKILKVNYRYFAGLHEKSAGMPTRPLYRIRSQILNQIIFKHAQYHSRPGIIEFH